MMERFRESCHRVVSYFQKIKKVVRRAQGEKSLQELSRDIASPQQLESKIAEERAKRKVKRAKRKRAKRAKGSLAKRQRARKRRARKIKR